MGVKLLLYPLQGDPDIGGRAVPHDHERRILLPAFPCAGNIRMIGHIPLHPVDGFLLARHPLHRNVIVTIDDQAPSVDRRGLLQTHFPRPSRRFRQYGRHAGRHNPGDSTHRRAFQKLTPCFHDCSPVS